jgi:hypothetical protein
MAGKKPTMRENISSRPTDKYGNRATDADLGLSGAGAAAIRRAAAKEITKREGTTSPSGARPALLRMAPPSKPAKAPAVKMPKAPQIIRTTTNMKPTPMGKKR